MQNKHLAILISFVLFIASCTETQTKHDGHQDLMHELTTNDVLPEIVLLNGVKWEVPSHMHNLIMEMLAIVSDDALDLEMVAGKMDEKIGELTSGCTMEGQGHDELHKILLPLIDAVEQMHDMDRELAVSAQEDARKLIGSYDSYFTVEKGE